MEITVRDDILCVMQFQPKWPREDRPKIIQAICARLANGEPMAVICRTEGMPSHDTVMDWAKQCEDAARSIARAREHGWDAIAERARMTARGMSGERGDSSGDWQRDKLIIETDLKLLAKWDPKRYGDRQVIDMSVSQTISIRDALAQAERRVIDVVATPVLAPPEADDDAS